MNNDFDRIVLSEIESKYNDFKKSYLLSIKINKIFQIVKYDKYDNILVTSDLSDTTIFGSDANIVTWNNTIRQIYDECSKESVMKCNALNITHSFRKIEPNKSCHVMYLLEEDSIYNKLKFMIEVMMPKLINDIRISSDIITDIYSTFESYCETGHISKQKLHVFNKIYKLYKTEYE